MYEERRNSFSLRDIILQILLIVLFVFIMVWLFPTKNYLKENNAIGTDELYTNYITNMTEAAKDYFTVEKLPTTVGTSSKLTLSEMLEQKLILEIGGNASCDLEKSYVRVTKMDSDYQLRVELSCEDYSNYVVVPLGCHDLCTDCNVVQKPSSNTTNTGNNTTTNKPTQQSTKKYTVTFDSNGGSAVSSQTVVSGKTATKPSNPIKEGYTFVEWTLNGVAYDFNKAVTSDITLVASWESNTVLYQYSKDVTNYSEWSDWSDTETYWGTLNYKNTDTKEYKIVSTGTAKTGETTTTCNKTTETVIEITDTKEATKKEQITEGTVIVDTKSEFVWVVEDEAYASDVPLREYYKGTDLATSETADTRYEFVTTQVVNTCEGCTNKIQYVYKKSVLVENITEVYSCTSGYTLSGTGADTKCTRVKYLYSCAAYGDDYKLLDGQCVKYETKEVEKENCTETDVTAKYTKYQYRTRTISTTPDIKWSENANDEALIAEGYKNTGVTRQG